MQQGVWIDVFCLDVAPDNLDTVLDKYENIKKRIRVYRNRKIGFYAFIPRIHYIIGHFLLRTYFLFNSLKKYRKNTENILRDDVNTYSGKKLWGFLIWSIVKKNIRKIAIHDISSYEETITMPFEDRFFPCHIDPVEIKENLLKQLTSPVRWTQSVINMIGDGMTEFVECGPGQVLTGLIGRIQKSMEQ